jgi:hypothetical protein
MMGFIGAEWEQHLISELDSALNKWLDAVPNHCQLFTRYFLRDADLSQCAGILVSRTHCSLTKRCFFIVNIITPRSWCIDLLFPDPDNPVAYLFHR